MKSTAPQNTLGECNPLGMCLSRCAARVLFAVLLAGLFWNTNSFSQNGDTPISTNEVQQTEETAVDVSQAGDGLVAEDVVSTNSVAETNTPAVPGPDGRTRRLRRRPPRPASASSSSSVAKGIGTNGAPSGLDYSAFRLVAERNIFDPNRAPRSSRAPTQTKTLDSFSLVGTMSYEKGDFAFFDGSSSDFKKVLKTNDVIAGYKILAISAELVTFASGTNQLDLKVGSQMRRGEDGHWARAPGSTTYAASASSSHASDAPASGAESDVVKKMMQRREKE